MNIDSLLSKVKVAVRAPYSSRREPLDQTFEDITASWDQPRFIEEFKDDWNPFPIVEAPKYLVLETWLKRAIRNYYFLGLFEDAKPRRVLDLGCGMGYFLVVCRHFGHAVEGLDLGTEPLYERGTNFFNLPVVHHEISPTSPLPDINGKFDVITAFMACFNLKADGSGWHEFEWLSFLEAIKTLLRPGGVFLVEFNAEPATGRVRPLGIRRAVGKCGGFDAKFRGDYMWLRRNEG